MAECPIEKETTLKPCHCSGSNDDEEKQFVYVEGTKQDKTVSEDDCELTGTVWYSMKPPQLFCTDYFPAVTARQIQIKRIQLQGKRKLAGDEDNVGKREKINVNIFKKKSAVRFLSNTSLASM